MNHNFDHNIKRIVHVTHTDLDGVSCEFLGNQLANFILEDPARHEVHPCTYENIDTVLYALIELIDASEERENTLLLITDIAPSDHKVVARLAEFAESVDREDAPPAVALLDHHVTARATFDKYPWYRYGDNKCGTELLFEYMQNMWGFPGLEANPTLAESLASDERFIHLWDFVEMVTDYDCWIKKLAPHCDNLNALFQLLGREDFITRCQKSAKPALLTSEEQTMVDVFAKKTTRDAMRALENGTKLSFGKDVVGHVVFSSANQSLIGQLARDTNVDADFVAIIDPVGYKVSLRSIKDGFHVGEFAKSRHESGGGHEKAAGYTLDRDQVVQTMISMLI